MWHRGSHRRTSSHCIAIAMGSGSIGSYNVGSYVEVHGLPAILVQPAYMPAYSYSFNGLRGRVLAPANDLGLLPLALTLRDGSMTVAAALARRARTAHTAPVHSPHTTL